MKYVKSCLIITMLVGIGYSQDCDPQSDVGWNCDCNVDTWQEYYPSMEGCYLPGAELYQADLSWAILAFANLTGADLSYANLWEADLSWANLSYANLEGASPVFANFYYADLSEATLAGAEPYGAFFVGATLDNTIFDGANLTYTYFDENEDTYDDASYDAGAESGDLNLDGDSDILDIVALVNIILNP